jgi:DNA-binding transcriptional ArsR family regulator
VTACDTIALMSAARRAPTLQQLASRVDELTRKVAALEKPAGRGTGRKHKEPAALTTATGDDLLRLVERRRSAQPRDKRGRRGAVVYAGSLELSGAEYLWGIERPLTALLELDPERPAHILATLAHPQRLRLLVALIEQPRTAAELQKVIGGRSPGPLYHHLRELLALGVVAQRERHYIVPARHVVPLLAALALAVDLGARTGDGDE